jgi:uncharacterized membrane protein
MDPSKFFTKKQKKKILKAIYEAENRTSGEIKLHIENHCDHDLIERAIEVFHFLQIYDTERSNGILIYMALEDKKVAIIGDEGINKVTPEDYWEKEVNMLLTYFKKEKFDLGILEVIERVGEKLKDFFPVEPNDLNELSDEISYFNN